MKGKGKPSKWLLILALAVLATSAATSGTLAKYASQFTSTASMQVAAFPGSGSIQFDVALSEFYPGKDQTVTFAVQNYENDVVCETAIDYEIQVTTTGNLPLTFALLGRKDEGGSTSVPAQRLDDDMKAESSFPLDGGDANDHQKHLYQLTMLWPASQTDGDYSQEIDLITVTVTAKQTDPRASA